jgi:protein O-GlcNAc transferase
MGRAPSRDPLILMARNRNPPRRPTGPGAPPGGGRGGVSPAAARALDGATAHLRAGRPDDAARLCRELLRREPNQPDALHMLALVVNRQGDAAEARRLLEAAARARPGDAGILVNLGNACAVTGRVAEAEAAFHAAAKARPGWAEPMNRLGVTLRLGGRPEEAERAYRAALAADPGHVEARADLAVVLLQRGRLEDAAEAAAEAIRRQPDHFGAWNTLAVVRIEQDDREGAITAYGKALAAAPEFAEGHFNLGTALVGLGRTAEATLALERAVALKPDYSRAVAHLATQYQMACRWAPLPELHAKVREAVRRGEAAIPPFALFSFETTPGEQLACAAVRAREVAERAARRYGTPVFAARSRGDGPITVGYVTADLGDHPVAHHLVPILEHHDRSRVRPVVYGYGPGAGSAMGGRIEGAADAFVDIGALSALEAARRIHADGVDILVELNGYTQHGRPDIPALRPAPVQAAYLGYPGTTGAPYIDYLIADRATAPPEHPPHYAERLALLPPSYLLYDPRRAPAPQPPDRAACGLPEGGPILCCFNHAYKITPEVFGAWMRLLAAVPDAVLWLRGAPVAEANLRDEAGRRGVDPARLVFAARVDDPAQYLARVGIADLFLDTHPYNAHATAADALRAGVPVVTRAGDTFASRVAGGLLAAVGLSELATGSLADYEALALRLVREPEARHALRGRLVAARDTSRLFDPGRFLKDLEGLYATMWARHAAGQAPATLDPGGEG